MGRGDGGTTSQVYVRQRLFRGELRRIAAEISPPTDANIVQPRRDDSFGLRLRAGLAAQTHGVGPAVAVEIDEARLSPRVKLHRLVGFERPAGRIEVLDVLPVDDQIARAVAVEIDRANGLPGRNRNGSRRA